MYRIRFILRGKNWGDFELKFRAYLTDTNVISGLQAARFNFCTDFIAIRMAKAGCHTISITFLLANKIETTVVWLERKT